VALIAGSWIEKTLEIGILSKFIKLEDDQRKRLFDYDHRGPISDFSARIKIAAALDLFGPKTHADLERIRMVRNAFAHSVHLLKFNTKEVADVCNELYLPTTLTLVEGGGRDQEPKSRYINTVITISRRIKTRMVSSGDLRFRPNLP
jgi:DNA-binding MltR family transcriptional regulator